MNCTSPTPPLELACIHRQLMAASKAVDILHVAISKIIYQRERSNSSVLAHDSSNARCDHALNRSQGIRRKARQNARDPHRGRDEPTKRHANL